VFLSIKQCLFLCLINAELCHDGGTNEGEWSAFLLDRITPGARPRFPIKLETDWASKPVCMRWTREKIHPSLRIELRFSTLPTRR
jgi:hypothetical protein